MDFESWWELNEEYCGGQSARYIALRAWSAVKAYHRIPMEKKVRMISHEGETLKLINDFFLTHYVSVDEITREELIRLLMKAITAEDPYT